MTNESNLNTTYLSSLHLAMAKGHTDLQLWLDRNGVSLGTTHIRTWLCPTNERKQKKRNFKNLSTISWRRVQSVWLCLPCHFDVPPPSNLIQTPVFNGYFCRNKKLKACVFSKIYSLIQTTIIWATSFKLPHIIYPALHYFVSALSMTMNIFQVKIMDKER